MTLDRISLDNFRNYEKREFEIAKDITLISGSNGSGKTNILEAILLLSVAKSPRTTLENQLINIESDYARIVGHMENGDKLEVGLARQSNSNRIKKLFKINNVTKTSMNFVGYFNVVLFAPEDIRLVSGSPSRRREYLDRMLSQIYPAYRRSLLKYNKVIRHRNKLLEQIGGQYLHQIQRSQLEIWNKQLLESGVVVQEYRNKFFQYAKSELPEISKNLYEEGFELELNYNRNTLSESRLMGSEQKDLMRGTTQIGPHRDDYEYIMKNSRGEYILKGYGSRGQQRTGVLCIKILELNYIESVTRIRPTLLLDDIFSELDDTYRAAIERIAINQQTVISTADASSVPDNIKENSKQIIL